jgi:hypothetical protein
MQVTTIEGIVKDGQIQLTEDIKLPESAKVYVVVPDMAKRTAKIMSPRLVNKSDAAKFVKTIEEYTDDEV